VAPTLNWKVKAEKRRAQDELVVEAWRQIGLWFVNYCIESTVARANR
jgi:hypothetical protein